jgi:glycosyltransferase 2 family protein
MTEDKGTRMENGVLLPSSPTVSGKSSIAKRRVRGLVQITISLILLALILRQVHWEEVWTALRRIEPVWLMVAWGLFLLGVVIRSARWGTLLKALGIRRPLRELVLWYFVGGFFNVILPTGFGGDAVRVAELAQDTQQIGRALNSVVVDRYLGIIVLLAMGLAAGILWPGAAPAGVLLTTAALFAAGLLAAWLLRRPWWAHLGGRADLIGRAVRAGRLPVLAEAIKPYDRRTIATGLAISLAFNVLQIGWNMAIARGLGLSLPPATYLVLVPLTALALLLPAFGGLGVRELTYVGLFGQVGVAAPTAVALSLGVYGITVATGLVGGVMYLVTGIRRTRADG